MPRAGWVAGWLALVLALPAGGQESSATPTRPERTILGGAATVALRPHGVPVVAAKVNGQEVVIAIDLGSAGTFHADSALAEKLRLPAAGRVRLYELGEAEPTELETVKVDRLELGAAAFAGLQGPVRNYAEFWPGMEKVDGVAGSDLFRDCLVTIDYPGKTLRIEPGALPDVDGREVLALAPGEPIPAVELTVGDRSLAAHLDTGSVTGVSLPPALAKDLKFASPLRSLGEVRSFTRTGQLQQGRLADSLLLGRHELQTPIVTVIDFLAAPNLGSDVLRHFTLTLDLAHGRARLARKGDEPIAFEARYLVGVMLERSENRLLVERVIPGSAADAAGLKAGDLILEMNGKPLAELASSELRDAFSQPMPVRLKLQRDGESLEVVVAPRRSDE